MDGFNLNALILGGDQNSNITLSRDSMAVMEGLDDGTVKFTNILLTADTVAPFLRIGSSMAADDTGRRVYSFGGLALDVCIEDAAHIRGAATNHLYSISMPGCPPGHRQTSSSSPCTPCPAGSYQDDSRGLGATNCKVCTDNLYNNKIGATGCLTCSGTTSKGGTEGNTQCEPPANIAAYAILSVTLQC